MSKQDIVLGKSVQLAKDSRIAVTGADVRLSVLFEDREDVYLSPENTFPTFTLFDAGTGQNTPTSRVMTANDTAIMDKAARIRAKYVSHMLLDPDNTVPIPDKASISTPKATKAS